MVDVWATGITLYMMLLGHVPFWAESITDIYDKIQVTCTSSQGCPSYYRGIRTRRHC